MCKKSQVVWKFWSIKSEHGLNEENVLVGSFPWGWEPGCADVLLWPPP